MRSWVQVMETASCRNAGKGCVHKIQSGRTFPRTLRKWELRAPGCPFFIVLILAQLKLMASDFSFVFLLLWQLAFAFLFIQNNQVARFHERLVVFFLFLFLFVSVI
jgi:hypothetical protein